MLQRLKVAAFIIIAATQCVPLCAQLIKNTFFTADLFLVPEKSKSPHCSAALVVRHGRRCTEMFFAEKEDEGKATVDTRKRHILFKHTPTFISLQALDRPAVSQTNSN